MPHYRDRDDQKPRAFIGLIEEVILPRLNIKSIPSQFRFHGCGIDCVFGIRRLWAAVSNNQTASIHQRVMQMRQNEAGSRQFVIRIRDEYGIHRT